jgi:AraC-like DNA-binding protein
MVPQNLFTIPRSHTEPFQQGNSFGLTAWHGPSRTMSMPHAHNDIEINFCDRPLVYSSGGKTSTLPAGAPCAFWGAKPHQLINFERGVLLAFATVPLAQFMSWSVPSPVKNRLLHGEVLIGPAKASHEEFAAGFDRWGDDLHLGNSGRRAAELEIEALLHRMSEGHWSEQSFDNARSSLDLTRAAVMAAHIADNADSRLTVDGVASSILLNANSASAIFTSVFGVSINRYVAQHRVAEAQRLLLLTTLDSGTIGRRVGFQSSSSFHEHFASICGTSPVQWRRLHDSASGGASDPGKPGSTPTLLDSVARPSV